MWYPRYGTSGAIADVINTVLMVLGGALCGAVVTLVNTDTPSRRGALLLLLKIVATVAGLTLFGGHILNKYTDLPHPIADGTAAFFLAATANRHVELVTFLANLFTKK
jgi:hypothetical protein